SLLLSLGGGFRQVHQHDGPQFRSGHPLVWNEPTGADPVRQIPLSGNGGPSSDGPHDDSSFARKRGDLDWVRALGQERAAAAARPTDVDLLEEEQFLSA